MKPPNDRCFPSGGTCDKSEFCTGTSASCPVVDSFLPAGTVCRASVGICDVAEACTGTSAFCPTDAKSTAVCRASAGICDVAESCNGVSNDCPLDVLAAAGTECRSASGVCDVAEQCDGGSAACPTDTFASAATVCRPATDRCDVEESCAGDSADCPPDVSQVAGTLCLDHFKCYDAETARRVAKFEPRNVLLADQFETKLTRVTKPVSMCNPVDKNGEGIRDRDAHLTCYKIKDVETKPKQPNFKHRNVVISNQFGDLTLAVLKADVLCVPSGKADLGPVLHVDDDDEEEDEEEDDD